MAGRLDADQAEHALGRLREAGYDDAAHPTVAALLDRLEQLAGKRHTNRVRKWFDQEASAREERKVERQRVGSVKDQRVEYRAYINGLAGELEAATRGHVVTPEMRNRQARGRGMSVEDILASNPATIRAHLSDEAMQHLGENERPLSFDAWRYAMLGARDSRAVESWTRRNAGYFGEWG